MYIITQFKRVVRVNYNEIRVRLSEMYLTLVNKKRDVHVTSENKEYIIPVVCKSKLIKSSSISSSILVVSKYSNVIPNKFKVIKFMLE